LLDDDVLHEWLARCAHDRIPALRPCGCGHGRASAGCGGRSCHPCRVDDGDRIPTRRVPRSACRERRPSCSIGHRAREPRGGRHLGCASYAPHPGRSPARGRPRSELGDSTLQIGPSARQNSARHSAQLQDHALRSVALRTAAASGGAPRLAALARVVQQPVALRNDALPMTAPRNVAPHPKALHDVASRIAALPRVARLLAALLTTTSRSPVLQRVDRQTAGPRRVAPPSDPSLPCARRSAASSVRRSVDRGRDR
jgi:hypothetical protein